LLLCSCFSFVISSLSWYLLFFSMLFSENYFDSSSPFYLLCINTILYDIYPVMCLVWTKTCIISNSTIYKCPGNPPYPYTILYKTILSYYHNTMR
jgi:hypothetical protein